MVHRRILQTLLAAAALVGRPAPATAEPVHVGPVAADSVRPRRDLLVAAGATGVFGVAVDGALSVRGLPPVAGTALITIDSGLVFRGRDGHLAIAYPLVGPARNVGGRLVRPSAVKLVALDETGDAPVYIFRLAGATLVTSAPGPLLELGGRPSWLDSLGPTRWEPADFLLADDDSAAAQAIVTAATSSAYADTLYAIFGRPVHPAGLVGAKGRAAGRLGEYLGRRDSLALDPARTESEAQLRHALAHELAHRGQRNLPVSVRRAWSLVPPIVDPKRYGYGDEREHQAEAMAFAVHYLQSTAATPISREEADALLSHYERLIPGTTAMVGYLIQRPIYRNHPLVGRQRAGDAHLVGMALGDDRRVRAGGGAPDGATGERNEQGPSDVIARAR